MRFAPNKFAKDGKPFMPSNATSGDVFMSTWCVNCSRFRKNQFDIHTCKLLTKSLGDEQPIEWIYKNGLPTCIAFNDKTQKRTKRPCKKTSNLFEE